MVAVRLVFSVVLAGIGGVACAQRLRGSPPPANATRAETRGDLRFEALARLVAEGGVRSVDDLLPRLPEDLRSRHVLLYESRSVQGASYANPRVVLYTRDGRFVVAYSGDPAQPGYRMLETMEFDDRERAFRFREVAFPAGDDPGGRAIFSEPNPPQCLACHGDDPRPVWDTYPTWPGAYGEQDHTRPDAEEAAGLAGLLARRASSPRYRALVGLEPDEARPPRDDVAAAYEGKSAMSPNAEFGLLLQGLAYRAIARQVTTSPRFPAFRYALLASLDPQCIDVEDFVPDEVRARFSRRAQDFEVETRTANVAQAAAKRRRTHARGDPPVLTQPETLTPFRYLVEEGLGLPTRAWTLALEKGTYDFTSPRRSTKLLEHDLLDAIGQADPSLRAWRDGSDHRDGYCAVLRKKSLALWRRP